MRCDFASFCAGALVVLLMLALMTIAHQRESARWRERALWREPYLVHPYLDLDAPGERGSPYALAECV